MTAPVERLQIKRAYEPASRRDGTRVLIDRLWPRGLKKTSAAIDDWRKDVAPTAALRQWFGHDPRRWPAFRRRYAQELRSHRDVIRDLAALASRRRVTLVYAAHDEAHNNAVVLAAAVRRRMKRATSRVRPARRRRKPAP
jgi:uncharacterized protein YeaO (DUF488 family)